MDYKSHYQRLIDRSQRVKPEIGYFEHHHIVPRCLGGTDHRSNLVYLTPEEHYVAHQLLTKIYPEHRGLSYAAMAMGAEGHKVYGWLRRNYSKKCTGIPKSEAFKESMRKPKPQAHKDLMKKLNWITDGKKNDRIWEEDPIPAGWRRGRTISWGASISKVHKESGLRPPIGSHSRLNIDNKRIRESNGKSTR
jgi:hypothetical protein